jgi:hypothetical protein
VIVNSAKIEVDFLRATGGKQGSGFLPNNLPSTETPNDVLKLKQ